MRIRRIHWVMTLLAVTLLGAVSARFYPEPLYAVVRFGLSFFEHEFAAAQSPDKSVRVSLRSLYIFPDYTVSFDVKSKSFHKRVVMPEDRAPMRSEIYWGNREVGILICDWSAPPVQRSINLVNGEDVPFDHVRSGLSAQIAKKYSPTEDELAPFHSDPVEWFCYDSHNQRLPGL